MLRENRRVVQDEARREEIEYFREIGVYEKVDLEECWKITGKAPIAVR